MDEMLKLISLFNDETGNVKEIDLTKKEDYEKVKKLLKLTKENFVDASAKYSIFGPLFSWLPSEDMINKLEKQVDEIYENSKIEYQEKDYECECECNKKSCTCNKISADQAQHLQNIVDRYMNEVIKPVMKLNEKDEKNMNLAFFDFAKWIYTI